VDAALTYPGTFQGQALDKAAVARQLEPVREFQRVYNAQIFVGEFSVVRYAPGAARYLQDCLELFEEYGWDWTYHAFRESTEWDLEHVDVPRETTFRSPPDAPSLRQAAIRQWLAKNRHANLAQ
jgi:hypothetical protein